MVGYVTLGTNDFARACAFYDALLGPLGGKRLMDVENFVVWGSGPVGMLAVTKPFDQKPATGSTTIDGTKWTVYDRRDEGKDAGNNAYALVQTTGKYTFVLAGTADDASFRTLATAVSEQFADR